MTGNPDCDLKAVGRLSDKEEIDQTERPMTGFIVSVFLFRNRVSSNEAFEGLELGEGNLHAQF